MNCGRPSHRSSAAPLAHVAILAREASVPTVVGLSGVMRSLEEGRHVDVDGEAGTVRASARRDGDGHSKETQT